MTRGKRARTPRALGYRMPAEWEPHEATWIAWPHRRDDWPGKFSTIPTTYTAIVGALAADERVEVLVQDARHRERVRALLRRGGVEGTRIRFHVWPTDRSWLRDSGPTFVRGARPASSNAPTVGLVHWKFNAWARYDDWRLDRRVPERVARYLRRPRFKALHGRRWIVLEGGAFDVSGDGLWMATEECLLEAPQERNPGLDRAAIESVVREYLAADEAVWLRRGIVGDDTHGHVDDVARFVGRRRVLLVGTDDPSDPNAPALQENRTILEEYRTRSGARLEVGELPSPRPVVVRHQRLPASYANFYVANRTVLVPTFDDPHDAEALDVVRRAFPSRSVVGIRCRDLVWGLGTLHCLTQQQPRGS